jgi:hypothetical protein
MIPTIVQARYRKNQQISGAHGQWSDHGLKDFDKDLRNLDVTMRRRHEDLHEAQF